MDSSADLIKKFSFERRFTWEVKVGDIGIGGNNPIRIQSMTNTDTMDAEKTVSQIIRMVDAGCELVRITAVDQKQAENLYSIKNELIKRNYNIPLIADIHFNPKAAEIAAKYVEKVRINPGNYTDKNRGKFEYTSEEYQVELDKIKDRLFPLIEICKENNTAIRIGTNHGSLSERIVGKYGNTPYAMAISAIEFTRICHDLGFRNIVLSQKSSNVKQMIMATRLLAEILDSKGLYYPLHLGVTEAGDGEDGRIKSSIGIGGLLAMGIGDTIRVSLTEDPEKEIPVAQSILQSTGDRIYKAEFISCPSCGRTKYDIQGALKKVKEECSHLIGVKIGVMGCIVNGPGEMADAHYGYVGAGEGKINLYRSKNLVYQNIDESIALEKLIEMIKQDGKWVER